MRKTLVAWRDARLDFSNPKAKHKFGLKSAEELSLPKALCLLSLLTTRGVDVNQRTVRFIQLAVGNKNWPQYKQPCLFSLIGHILTYIKLGLY